jgi:hypothetical protein
MPRRTVSTSAALVLGLAAVACTSPATGVSPSETAAVVTRTWARVELPDRVDPVTLTAYGDGVLVGTRSTGTPPGPGLLLLTGGRVGRVPVSPASPYGAEARWLAIAREPDGALVAVGGARGGAHANVRWTVWRGRPETGLVELAQSFSVFGGWGAGDQVDVVATQVGPMLLGSWESATTGLDADIWLPDGARWVRQDPAGTALASTPAEMVGPRSATPLGDRALIAGSVLHLGDGARQSPAVWRSTRGNEGWSRLDLPDRGTSGEAVSATCRGTECTVAGWVDGRLALWHLGTEPQRLTGVPDVAVPSASHIPPPVLTREGVLLLVSAGGRGRLLELGSGGWRSEPGPVGTVERFVGANGTLYATTREGDGRAVLWSTDP